MGAASERAALSALHTWLDGTTIDRLARVLAITHSGAVRLVDRLAAAGLVERRAGHDGRTVAVTITDAGRQVGARVQADRQDVLQALLAPLDDGEREQLAVLLGKLLSGMTPDHEVAGNICRLCDPDACGHPDTCPVTLAARGPGSPPAH